MTEAEKFGWSFGGEQRTRIGGERSSRTCCVVEPQIPDATKDSITQSVMAAPWWLPVNRSDWRHPNGPLTNITKTMDHPVTQVKALSALPH